MNQIARIKKMEQQMERASQAVMALSAALDQYAEAQEALAALRQYYGSDEWRHDFTDEQIRP